jgi:hypothetical protein
MPRFVTRSLTVEAFQYDGTTVCMPDAFRLALLRHLPNGTVEFLTGDGPRACKFHDWILRGPDGQLSIVREATFEMMFAPAVSTPPPEALQPAPTPAAVKRIKEKVHG